MAFQEIDRVTIRDAMGASALFVQAWPALENAITQAQSQADGGQRPDNTTELRIRAILAALAQVDAARLNLINIMFVGSADEAHIDPARADAALCKQGRSFVKQLCSILSFTGPVSDRFSAAPVIPVGEFAPRVLGQ